MNLFVNLFFSRLMPLTLLAFGSMASPRLRAQEPQGTAESILKSISFEGSNSLPREDYRRKQLELHQTNRQRVHHESSLEWSLIRNRKDWEVFREKKIANLRKSLGWPDSLPASLSYHVTKRIELEEAGVVIENVTYESRPNVWVTANLYRPKTLPKKLPGILISHAHHTSKEHGELQDMGMTWARAGCYVLVPDHFGHGERRQHPFLSESSYPSPFRVTRQDYYFRYDTGIKLHLLDESLMGWLTWDLSRGVDCLLKQSNIDRDRIILLGAVAGGGDPCAVAAALDPRITAAVPFNFGGPQPETGYPLPDDAEASFNYSGNGSWESTRNLTRSCRDGFLPWVIVGSVAPRRLIYAHEFQWDQERDPVWKRLQSIYRLFEVPDSLDFTHGRGELKGSAPESTHCTHIGPYHRARIHEAFRRWFQIEVDPTKEYSQRLSSESLHCYPKDSMKQVNLRVDFFQRANEMIESSRRSLRPLTLKDRSQSLRSTWRKLIHDPQRSSVLERIERIPSRDRSRGLHIEQYDLYSQEGIVVPSWLIQGTISPRESKKPVVWIVSHSGAEELMKKNASEYAILLEKGYVLCLADLRGTGRNRLGEQRGRTSTSTIHSSSLLMQGDPLLAGQFRDAQGVLNWLKQQPGIDSQSIVLWGDARTERAEKKDWDTVPRDDDSKIPPPIETVGSILPLLVGLFQSEISELFLSDCIFSYAESIRNPEVLLPHDTVVPGFFRAGDIVDLMAVVGSEKAVFVDRLVGGTNTLFDRREVETFRDQVQHLFDVPTKIQVDEESQAISWLVERI